MTPRVQISTLASRKAVPGSGRHLWAEEADAMEGVEKRTEVSFTEMTGWVENVGYDVQLLVCSNRRLWSLGHLDTLQGTMKNKKRVLQMEGRLIGC